MSPIAETDFYSKFSSFLKRQDTKNANSVLMEELGKILATNKEDFIYVLKFAGVQVPDLKYTPVTDITLIDLFVKNAPKNKKLLLGAAYLISHNNKMTGVDGEEYTSNACADVMNKVMTSHFCGCSSFNGNQMGFDGDRMSNFEGDPDSLFAQNHEYSPKFSNADDSIVGAVGAGLGATSAIFNDISQNKKLKAATDPAALAAAQQQAKAAMLQGTIDANKLALANAGKQTDAQIAAESSKKTKIIVLGVTAGVLILATAGLLIAKAIKKRKAAKAA
jgi:hypothetical protein